MSTKSLPKTVCNPLRRKGLHFLRSGAGLPNVYQNNVLPGNPHDFRAFCCFAKLFCPCKGCYTFLEVSAGIFRPVFYNSGPQNRAPHAARRPDFAGNPAR